MTKKIEPPFIRSPYNYDMNKASQESALECKDDSLAKQEFVAESDINFIADRYGLTGEMPQVTGLVMGEFSDRPFDFQEAMNYVIQTREQFMTLPAKVRARFRNDPQELINFLDNPDNLEEARFLKLVNPAQTVQDAPQSTRGAEPDLEDKVVPTSSKAKETPPNPPKKDT